MNETAQMTVTTALTGMLPFIVVISALLSGIVSLWLLRRYRAAVLRGMNAAGGSMPDRQLSRGPATARAPLNITRLGTAVAQHQSGSDSALYQQSAMSLRRLGLVYAVAGLAYALVLSAPWLYTAGGGLPLTRLLWLVAVYYWPAMLVWLMVATETNRGKCAGLAVYFLALMLIGGVAVVRNTDLEAGQLVYHWLFANAAATALAAAFLTRRIRAAGPLVLAFMITGVSGALLGLTLLGNSDAALRTAATTGAALGLGAQEVFVLLHLVGFALFGLLGWHLLGRLGSSYRNKRMSDQSLAVDSLWLLFAVMQSFTLAFEGWGWIFSGLVAFTAYRIVARRGFALVGAGQQVQQPGLLLLRVFALGRRSERLFENLSRRWLRVGSIDLIAGPDLLTRTVEPHEFLDFLGGRLSRRFIEDEDSLRDRLAARDTLPDPDGKYRVNEFFCREDSWQATVRHIAKSNDAVLMDLRSFSPDNQGCLWELEQLLSDVPLERVLLLTDGNSDQQFLEEKIQEIWRLLPAEAPNSDAAKPQVRLFLAEGHLAATCRVLTASLLEAARC